MESFIVNSQRQRNAEVVVVPNQKGYKIRYYVNGRSKDGNEYRNYSLTVPSDIAEALPNDLTFVPRMVTKSEDGVDGLLFEPVKGAQSSIKLPEWAQQENNNAQEQQAEAA